MAHLVETFARFAFLADVERSESEAAIRHALHAARRLERPVALLHVQPADNSFMSKFIRRYALQERLFQIVASVTYKSDIMMPYNGGIVICLPNTDRQQAEAFARQLNRFVNQRSGLDVKIGLACFPTDGLSLDDLAQAAARSSCFWPPAGEVNWLQAPGVIARFVRRVIEVDLMLALLVFALPLMAVIALALRLAGSGSVFAAHWRSGSDGRRFKIYRFRADSPIGRCLRKTCLDELPQIFNVLRGDLSLIGTPPLVWELETPQIPSPGGQSREVSDKQRRWDSNSLKKLSSWMDSVLLWRAFAHLFHKAASERGN